MRKFKTPEFKRLQKEWYARLKAEGFEDIEDTNSEYEFLKDWHSTYFEKRHDPVAFEAKQEYYAQARRFLHTHSFESERDRQIWERHAEGMSLRAIAKELNLKLWLTHRVVEHLEAQLRWSLTLLG